ncbi:MAG: UDP-N-acetylglucosamine 2-epimerase [Haliangiales bacterium]
MPRKILFITGTRADFGKLKSLIRVLEDHPDFEPWIFITGMHTLSLYGDTWIEVRKSGFSRLHVFHNQYVGEPMPSILANTIQGLSRYVAELDPDLIVVHGDRVEALAGALVGTLSNIRVAHVEGGERSGTVDELIRHAVSKISHLHFVANEEARFRLIQMGENDSHIFVVGSPDIDVMLSDSLPSIEAVRAKYEIPFEEYGVVLFHPVTTEHSSMGIYARQLVDAVLASGRNFVVIYPNNDLGTSLILPEYERLREHPNIRLYPSIAFEYFLTLLENAQLMVGNSSAGVREAPVYGVRSINIGTRQNLRFTGESIRNVSYESKEILEVIQADFGRPAERATSYFGDGRSAEHFLWAMTDGHVFHVPQQKVFKDLSSLSLVTMAQEVA